MDSPDSIFDSLWPAPLGPLERQVHRAVWTLGSATVREVIQDRKIWQTYSTILTTMDRLHRKGLLDRVQEGKAFRYSARYSPEELERRTAMRGLQHLLESEDAPLHLSYFVEAVGAQDEKLLDHLQSMVERQRAEMRNKKGEEK
ncbi:MAG TPA: BlaI/MecI/CopY family transcriptional regulator [Terriglobales bacterium]|nr:BlaI/MecI/CopY family transcriptional regulator [Terriglobales bacterium]